MAEPITFAEIRSQPQVWARVLEVRSRLQAMARILAEAEEVVFVGCGSSFFLAQAAAATYRWITGHRAAAHPASEVFLFPDLCLRPPARRAAVLLSRSGETSEVLRAAQLLREEGVVRCGVTAYGDRPLAAAVDEAVVLPEAQEESVVMTRSFTAMWVACALAAQAAAGQGPGPLSRLPELGEEELRAAEGPARRAAEELGAGRTVFLGAGPLEPIAREAQLKALEMAQAEVLAYAPLEFRHGPISLVEPGALAVLLATERARLLEQDLVADVVARGARAVAVGAQLPPELGVSLAGVRRLPDPLRAPLALLFGQLLAAHLAVLRGKDPDRPRHLGHVVHLGAEPFDARQAPE